MSWNAAKRALALGYQNVAWYPDGTDGWHEAGLPLQDAGKPIPAGRRVERWRCVASYWSTRADHRNFLPGA